MRQIVDLYAAVVQTAVARHHIAVFVLLKRLYVGNIRQSRADAMAVDITKALLDIILLIKFTGNTCMFAAKSCQIFHNGGYFGFKRHTGHLLCLQNMLKILFIIKQKMNLLL